MKTIARHMVMILSITSPALAANGIEPEGNGLLVILFLGFGALIIVFQLIPGLMLFGSMVKGLFCKPTKTTFWAGRKTAKTN